MTHVSNRSRVRPLVLPLALLSLAVATACEPSQTEPPAGLAFEYDVRRVAATDSVGTPLPPPVEEEGPGYFRGVVRSNVTTAGPDTLATSVRLAGVIVRAIPLLGTTGPSDPGTMAISPSTIPPGAGPVAATVITAADGSFQFPTLPGGRYMVTFEPVTDEFTWAWVLAIASPSSGNLPWWVTLSRTK